MAKHAEGSMKQGVPKMRAVRVGVVGLGRIAEQTHLPGLSRSPNAEIYAITDPKAGRLDEIGEIYGVPPERRFQDYEAMLELPELQAVDLATPNHAHRAQMLAACGKRKHVCVEKPLAMDLGQAQEMAAAAKNAGIVTMVCFSYRFFAALRFAKWVIDKGYVGAILNANLRFLKSSAFIENRRLEWRFRKELAGSGVLGDLGSHMVDLVHFLCGEVRSVCAQKSIVVGERRRLDSDEVAAVTTDDSCNALASLEGGAMANIMVTRCARGSENGVVVEVFGTEGMLRFDSAKPEALELCSGGLDLALNSAHFQAVPASFGVEQMDCFAKAVQGSPDAYLPDITDGLRCQRVLDAMLASSEGKGWVEP
jgi:predicted dehydrogenase